MAKNGTDFAPPAFMALFDLITGILIIFPTGFQSGKNTDVAMRT